MRKLDDAFARPLSITFERSCQSGDIPKEQKRANVTLVFNEDKQEDAGNYRPVSLASAPRKVVEQLILEIISKCLKDKKVI